MGFETVRLLAARKGAKLRRRLFWNALRARVTFGEESTTLLMPLSYVNRTGPVVRKAAKDLKVPVDGILIVIDDFWLPPGRIRIRRKGGDGGHNGLESLIRALGTEEFARLRIGIGEPDSGEAVEHVLTRFTPDEQEKMDEAIRTAADAVAEWAEKGPEAAMNRYNG